MRATANFLTLCVGLGLTLNLSWAFAGPHPLTGVTSTSVLAVGQAPGDDAQLAEQWLQQARAAMQQGKLDLAEYYIQRAEKLNVNNDPLFSRFKDSPAKARQDLAAMRADGPAAGGPEGGNFQNPPADPFQGLGPAASRDSAFQPTNAGPQRGGNNPAQQPHSDQMLLEARRALAAGDFNRATQLVEQTKQLGMVYPLHADSPTKVEGLIVKARQFVSGPPPQADQQAFTYDYAQFLMDQAEGLLRYGQFEPATRLAQQAKSLPANYRAFDRSPDKLLDQIAAARRVADSNPQAGLAANSGSSGRISDLPPSNMQRLPDPPAADGKAEAQRLVAESRMALDRGDVITAKRLAEQAHGMRVPDTAFAANETRPWEVLLEVNKAVSRQGYPVAQAGSFDAQNAYAAETPGNYPVTRGLYDPTNDPSRIVQAQGTGPTAAVANPANRSAGMQAFQQGMQALSQQDRNAALQHFRAAWQFEGDLDPLVRQQLQDKLIAMQQPDVPLAPNGQDPSSPLQAVDAQQQLLRQKLYREITHEQAEAQKQSVTDPKGALLRLEQLRERVASAEVDASARKQLLTLVDRSVDSLQRYIDQNRSEIELNDRNRDVLAAVEMDSERRQEVRNKIAELVDQFNTLMDELRFAEAEVIAKQARELDPEEPVVKNLMWQSRMARRIQQQVAIEEQKEQSFYDQMTSVLESSRGFDDRFPFQFGDARRWADLSQDRGKLLEQQRHQLSETEMEIHRAMRNKVDVNFTDRPLLEVMDVLSQLSGVPIFLDPQGLAAEGVTTDTPVTIRLNQQISLKSALNLVLEPLRLSYVIQNEVLRVTSEQTRNANVYHKVYNVADLVIPIPNFVPGYNIGLPGAIQAAHNALGYGGMQMPNGPVPMTVASNQNSGAMTNASVLAQMGASGMVNSLNNRPPQPMGFGPGGMGGAALADFDTLIELITSTIAPDSWDEVGGAGAIEPFPTNLSLVISQTQDIHEQIADLLDQLRKLQDLQVTIEVRFITLNDNFFERMGIDFDFDINDNVNVNVIQDDGGPSVVFGLDEMGPTVDLDLSFNQDSFGVAVPQFGNFDAATAANFGFAILSDIEVFFLLQAAEGDTRSNVLQAPKVTLFNGQTASVSDVSQRPFVTSIIPVVGDFAAAQQPVIVVLSEGTSLSVQAVVSSDRRFVRLTLVPFFSRIGDVEEFTFDGKTTTDTGTIVVDDEGIETGRENQVVEREGTTVQLPTFIFTTVNTTVSVPDGGTVLLGGIKRLSEGRNERGVPMLSKLPYVNRLFKNVGIGRTTQSLMMMVTPRIIIQEEEELNQTGYDSTQ